MALAQALISRCWPGPQTPEGLTGQDDPLPSWLLAGGLSSWPHGPLPGLLECPNHMAAGFPQSKRPREQGGGCNAFYNLISGGLSFRSFTPSLLPRSVCQEQVTKYCPHWRGRGLSSTLEGRRVEEFATIS